MCETESVPDFCTCGAHLPPDARFCHKCGKPQFEYPVIEPEEPVSVPVAIDEPPAAPPEVGFRNPIAVRISLLVGLLGFIATAVSGPFVILPLLWLPAAGFLSVYLYRRRTGFSLALSSGVRMGWMTGLFAFLIALVLFSVAAFGLSDPKVFADAVNQLRARGATADMERALQILRSPALVGLMVLTSFIMFTLLAAIGGAIGAKLLSGDRSRP